MLFEDLSLSKSIQKPYLSTSYLNPTPIQEQSIPIVLSGRDLMVVLKQEQEKQVHLPIPIIHHYTELLVLQRKQKTIRALVVTPTRISSANYKVLIHMQNNLTQHDFGGVSQNPQVDTLKMGLTF
jgi:ATP-dependent RNA helicase RhlE